MSLPACIAPSSTTLGCLLHVPELLHVCESKEDNALKAKLRRLCEEKKGGKLNVPQWLHDEWKNGDHLLLARQFQACNFDKAASPKRLFLTCWPSVYRCIEESL